MFESGSPPPSRAAIEISRARRVNTWPRLASAAPFLRRIVAQCECPDIYLLLQDHFNESYSLLSVKIIPCLLRPSDKCLCHLTCNFVLELLGRAFHKI